MNRLLWAVVSLALLTSLICSCYWHHRYSAMKTQLVETSARAEAEQAAIKKQQKEAVDEYEAKAKNDSAAIASLRGELERLRSAARRLQSGKSGAASGVSSGTGEKHDDVGIFLEGAELAAEGAELARKEHTALTACVDMYNRAK